MPNCIARRVVHTWKGVPMKTETLVLLLMAVLVIGPLVSALVAEERPVEPTGPVEFAGQVDEDAGEAVPEFLVSEDEGDEPRE